MSQNNSEMGVIASFVACGFVTYITWSLISSAFLGDSCQLDIPLSAKTLLRTLIGLGSYLDAITPQLIECQYPTWFAVALCPGMAALGGVGTLTNDKGFSEALKSAGRSFLGALVGLIVGLILFHLIELDRPMMHASIVSIAVIACGMMGDVFSASLNLKKVLRGTQILDKILHVKKPEKVYEKAHKNNQTVLAGVCLERDIEVRHFAIMGTTGTGKSVAFRELMRTAIVRGDRLVVADPDGGYMQHFFLEGDVILNPFDARCVKWDYFSEIETESDYRFMAASILPYSGDARNNQWIEYGQQLITAASRTWHEKNIGDSCAFFHILATASTEKLGVLCEGTSAARFFEDGNERMLGSILSTVAPAIEALRPLMNVQGEPFSIRHWIRQGKHSALWMPYKANQIAALRGLVSCWMRIAVFETLSLDADLNRRIWFHIDELDALGRIEGLKDALARIRKFGGCVVLGFQSISQLRAVYGSAEANTLIETCNNKLILRCEASEGGGTAEFASTQIGEREVEWDAVSHSTSTRPGTNTNTVSKMPKQRTESAVLASEIMQLPDLTGYLKLSNQAHWQKVRFEYVPYQKRMETFVPMKRVGVEMQKSLSF